MVNTGQFWADTPPSAEATNHDAQCRERAHSKVNELLVKMFFTAQQEAAFLLDKESKVVSEPQIAEFLGSTSVGLFQNAANAASSACEWMATDIRAHELPDRKQINVALQDALAWQVISQMHSHGDIDSQLCDSPLLQDAAVRSRLKNACHKHMRQLFHMGTYLQSFFVPSANNVDAVSRGGRRRRKKTAPASAGEKEEPAATPGGLSHDTHQKTPCAKEEKGFTTRPEPLELGLEMGANGPAVVGDVANRNMAAHIAEARSQCDLDAKHAASASASEDTPEEDGFHMDSASIHEDTGCGAPTEWPVNHSNNSDSCSILTHSDYFHPQAGSFHAPGLHSLQLKPTPQSSNALQVVLDDAFSALQSSIQQSEHVAVTRLVEDVPQWQERVKKARARIAQPELTTSEWIRNCSEAWQERALLVLCMGGVSWLLPIIENTNDDAFLFHLYTSLRKYMSIYELEADQKQETLSRLLGVNKQIYTPSYYTAYVKLLGYLLQGSACLGASDWAFASSPYWGHETLLAAAVAKLCDIAHWWHRNHFKEDVKVRQGAAELLSHALGALLRVFDVHFLSAPGLQVYLASVEQIREVAGWVIFDFAHLSHALDSAKRLLQLRGPESFPSRF